MYKIDSFLNTVVEQWISIAEVNQSWEGLDAIALGQLRILDFNHLNAKQITFVVNVFQLNQDLITSLAVGLIYDSKLE